MPDSLDNAIERLSAEFCPLVDPDDVTDVITQCSHELNTATKRARPELVEAVARKRLLDRGGHVHRRRGPLWVASVNRLPDRSSTAARIEPSTLAADDSAPPGPRCDDQCR